MNSGCKGLTEQECNRNSDCIYTTGTRKYCRSGKNILKYPSTQKRKPPISSSRVRSRSQNYTKKVQIKAADTIKQFFKNTEHRRSTLFLKSICADSGACISFGKEIDKINAFFNYYTQFEYAIPPVKKIGQESANGFIKEITYERDGYIGHAVLKSSIKKKADNLMYEYEVGQFINGFTRIFPCFLETYGLYHYKNNTAWNYIKNHATIGPKVLKNNLSLLTDIDYKVGCPDSKVIAILTQHVDNAISIKDFVLTSNKHEINGNLPYLLYQIYFCLYVLKDIFTHYDLHDENVLLYEPVKGSYITYHYHLNSGETVEFQSKYIAKIIDYGRCYYYKGPSEESKTTYNHVCSTKECKPNCGYTQGLAVLGPEPNGPGSFYYISSLVNNQSHDLRLINNIKTRLKTQKTTGINKVFANLLKKLVYNNEYGTKPIETSGLPGAINNVSDVYKTLENMIQLPAYKQTNELSMNGLQKIGDFHIYENRQPMHFESNQL